MTVDKLMALADEYGESRESVALQLGANAGYDDQDPLWLSMNQARQALRAAIEQSLTPGEPVVVDGNTSDGYHTFNELYEFRKAYNAALFNEWAVSGKCSVHKSWRHHDGELCFGGGWFIVVAVLPNGQISNHYEAKDWDLFAVPETERALFEFDGHTGADVVARLKAYTAPQSQPKQEPVACRHEWFRTGAMAPGESRCIHCGKWANTAPQPQPKQEPVAIHQYRSPHCSDWYDGIPDHHDGHGPYEVRTLYLAPQPQREWVGLTDRELLEIYEAVNWNEAGEWDYERAIEAKLREKNGGTK